EVYHKTWKPDTDDIKAYVIFLHAFAGHIGLFEYVFSKFKEKGIEVNAFDRRGHGRTCQKYNNPGVTGGWEVAIKDISDFILKMQERNTRSAPCFLMGQSVHKFDVNEICMNPNFIEEYKADHLVHKTIALNEAMDIVTNGKMILKEHYKNIKCPILLMYGKHDIITDTQAIKDFEESIRNPRTEESNTEIANNASQDETANNTDRAETANNTDRAETASNANQAEKIKIRGWDMKHA
ncbi:13296_t:CDS:2, partial [Racocetra fulgida]